MNKILLQTVHILYIYIRLIHIISLSSFISKGLRDIVRVYLLQHKLVTIQKLKKGITTTVILFFCIFCTYGQVMAINGKHGGAPCVSSGHGHDLVSSSQGPEHGGVPIVTQPQPVGTNIPKDEDGDRTCSSIYLGDEPCERCVGGATLCAGPGMLCGLVMGAALGCTGEGLVTAASIGTGAGLCAGSAMGTYLYLQEHGTEEARQMCMDVALGETAGVCVGTPMGMLGAVMNPTCEHLLLGALSGAAVGGACGAACGACLYCIQTRLEQRPKIKPEEQKGEETPLVITTQPKPRPKSVYMESSFFIPGYNRGAQVSSLLGMQGMLLGASEHVSTTLKLLALKAHNATPDTPIPLYTGNTFNSTPQKSQGPSKRFQKTLSLSKKRPSPISYQMFGFTDGYESNLERKIRSGRAGVTVNVMPGVCFAFAYNRYKDDAKKSDKIQLRTGSSSIKTNTKTDGLSIAIALNPNEKGFTGHLSSCYGWGKVKTQRSFTHANSEAEAKGNPDINLSGGLVQLGYNLPITKTCLATPYIEYMVSTVTWSPYKEKSGPLPCTISKNKENVIEKSIGLRNHWDIEIAELQLWIAGISGNRNTAGLTSRPLAVPLSWYEASIPVYKKQYIRTELGVSYDAKLMENLMVGLKGALRLEKVKKLDRQNISFHMQYTY